MASITLPPDPRTQLKRFIEMQFRVKPKRPPQSLSFAGRTVVITGGYIGIGLACASEMLDHDLDHLIIAVRSVKKGELAATSLRQTHRNAKIEVWQLDMLDYSSVQAFARRCATLAHLDIAILNAGVSGTPKFNINPSTGHEGTIQVNFLSTALLGTLLLPFLARSSKNGEPGRLTAVVSATAFTSPFASKDANPLLPTFDKLEGLWNIPAMSERYAVSKLLLMMFMLSLSEKVSPRDVVINMVEPGFTAGTGLQRHAKGVAVKTALKLLNLATHTLEHAAWTYVDAASVQSAESHGSFLMNYRIFPFPNVMYTPSGRQATERLWVETIQELEFAGVRQIVESIAEPI
ncbi:hypothetical protein LTR56_001367 [Elasticomyces elasticus]|nr:hypothetical protein LTR56_001367 [Elasticomyces elasticus]KAK3667548.1 hypothetical protein LTR22_001726 [Elasticomyces elasticus]KAK4927972.1 hypothetical protein LTR49_005171 [Elasticomyces elasticus]KAK5762409.1 hypothetical protein LTS12_007386 [Elasticomyces elasticus]